MGANEAIADAIIRQAVDLLRLEAGYNRAILRLLRQMEAELVGKLTGRELTEFSRQRLLDLLADARAMIARTYIAIRDEVDLESLATVQARAVAGSLSVITSTAAVPSVATLKALVSDLLVQGAPSAEWWSRQAGDTQFRFSNAIRQGVAQGETNAQIVARIRRGAGTEAAIVETSRRNAEALVRTSVQTVANAARLEVFRENEDVLEGVRQISTLDSRTSDVCIAYSGAEWDFEGTPINGTKLPFNGGPPRHWSCRSVLTPVVKPIPGLDFRPSRASADGQVRGDISFADWLSGKSRAFQDELLGPGRAQLWRDGTITLQQLLDQRGRPLTLEQLRDRYQ